MPVNASPSFVSWSSTVEIVGASLTALTIRSNAVVAVYSPSETVTVIEAEPDWLPAGVICTVRSSSEPAVTMLPGGSKVVIGDVAENIYEAGGLSGSEIVKERTPVCPSSSMV